MKTKLKRTLCLLVIAVMLLTAAGCSAANPQATAQPTQAPATLIMKVPVVCASAASAVLLYIYRYSIFAFLL